MNQPLNNSVQVVMDSLITSEFMPPTGGFSFIFIVYFLFLYNFKYQFSNFCLIYYKDLKKVCICNWLSTTCPSELH